MLLRLIAVPLIAGSFSFSFLSSTGAPPEAMHLSLTGSTPEANAMVHEIPAIQLVFSEMPQKGTVGLRILDAQEELVESPKPEPHGDDGTTFEVALADGLEPGTYTVRWRAMGSDSHVVSGDFGFVVMSHSDDATTVR